MGIGVLVPEVEDVVDDANAEGYIWVVLGVEEVVEMIFDFISMFFNDRSELSEPCWSTLMVRIELSESDA